MNARIQDVYPLAPGQGGILFQSLGGAPGAYVIQIVLEIEGHPDPMRETHAWEALVARHDVLRTAFVWKGQPRPLQVVGRRASGDFTAEDLSHLDEQAAHRAAEDWQGADRARGFDLSRAPLLRAKRFYLGQNRHRMIVSFHHAILDGWSIPILLSDWMALYSQNALPPARQFRDLVDWTGAQDGSKAQEFWRAELAQSMQPATLPAPATPPQDRRGDVVLHLSAEETAALERTARKIGLTLASTVHGCWGALMARLSGGGATYGLARAGRPAALPAADRRVGMFLNTLPITLRLDASATLARIVSDAQARVLAQAQHEHLSLAEAQAAGGQLGSAALMQSAVVFENYPTDPGLLGSATDFTILSVEVREQTSLPLTLFVIPKDGLTLRLLSDAGLITGAAAEGLLADLRRLLARFRAAPDTPIADIATQTRPIQAPPIATAPADITRRLAAIWQGILGGDLPQGEANFFDLGGHSLLALTLQERIRQEFGLTVEIADIFRFATLAGQAGHIGRLGNANAPAEAPGTRIQARSAGTQRLQARRARTTIKEPSNG